MAERTCLFPVYCHLWLLTIIEIGYRFGRILYNVGTKQMRPFLEAKSSLNSESPFLQYSSWIHLPGDRLGPLAISTPAKKNMLNLTAF